MAHSRPLGTAVRPEPAPGGSAAAWLIALALVARLALLVAPIGASFVLVTALAARVVEEEAWRWAIGGAACLVGPWLLHRYVASLVGRTRFAAPSTLWFLAGTNVAIAVGLALGFADDAGRALRRHGDWFVGERNGLAVRGYRAGVGRAAAWLERFDPPVELAPVVLPPDPDHVPAGPWLPGQEPPPTPPTTVAWFHPLAGPRRAMPLYEARRFGAARPQPRPSECELGHCGVDLGTTVGEPVFAIFDGRIERIERDAERGGRAGRYVRIGHKNGTVVSRYIHLDSIRDGLKEGDTVAGGELIGRLGRSGIKVAGAHLHFGLSLREGGPGHGERYVDPEPLLRTWQLPIVEGGLGKVDRPLVASAPASAPAGDESAEPTTSGIE